MIPVWIFLIGVCLAFKGQYALAAFIFFCWLRWITV
jgi:hypothetical protein